MGLATPEGESTPVKPWKTVGNWPERQTVVYASTLSETTRPSGRETPGHVPLPEMAIR